MNPKVTQSKPKTIDRQYTPYLRFYKAALLTFLLTQRIVRPQPNDYRKTIRFGLSAKRKITFSRLFKPPRITFFKVFQAAVITFSSFLWTSGEKTSNYIYSINGVFLDNSPCSSRVSKVQYTAETQKKINWKAITCREVRGNIILKMTYVNVL